MMVSQKSNHFLVQIGKSRCLGRDFSAGSIDISGNAAGEGKGLMIVLRLRQYFTSRSSYRLIYNTILNSRSVTIMAVQGGAITAAGTNSPCQSGFGHVFWRDNKLIAGHQDGYKRKMNTRMRIYRNAAALAAILAVLLLSVPGCEDPGSYGEVKSIIPGRLVVYKSLTAPSAEDPRDPVWDDIPAYGITVGDPDSGYTHDAGKMRVVMQAVAAGGRLFIRAEWLDASLDSIPGYLVHIRDTAITVDTLPDSTIVTDTLVTAIWKQQSNFIPDSLDIRNPDDTSIIEYYVVSNRGFDQDRFVIMWDVGDNGGEGVNCQSMCHAPEDTSVLGHRMYTTGGGHVDVWEWDIATGDPVKKARDQFWSSMGRLPDETLQPIAAGNFDTVLSRPLYVHRDTLGFRGPYLHSGQSRAYTPAEDSIAWPNGFVVPGYVVFDNALGSVADVTSYSSYYTRSLRWLIVLSRQLNAPHPDDIDFAGIQPGDSILATIAIMNNADRLHSGSAPFYVVFP